MLNTLGQLGAVLVLVLLNGFFVAAEFALVGARRTHIDQLAEAGNRVASVTRQMIDDLDRYIAAAQLGITLASLALGWIGEAAISSLIEPPIEYGMEALLGSLSIAESIATVISHAIGVAVSFFIITTLHIVLGEQAPKVFAIRSPERVALWITRPLALFNTLFAPLIRFLDWATDLVLRAFGVREPPDGHSKVHSAQELRMLVEESGEAGQLNEEAQEMLMNVLAFADRPAYQAMVPRREMITIDHDATVQDFFDLFARSRHTRYPVVGPNGIDDVQGVISAKDLLLALQEHGLDYHQPITPFVREAFFTPESKPVGLLMQELRDKHTRLAILIDEYGGVAGLVTLEDLIEEIVGELQDDYEEEEHQLQLIDERTTEVEGQIRIDEINDELDIAIPAGEYDTLAGFILEQLGRMPVEGDQLCHDNVTLTVVEMRGPRVARIRVTKEG